jgi:hypothetical protein
VTPTPGPEQSELIDGYAIVGLTYIDATGDVTEQLQIHGVIESVDDVQVTLRLGDGEPFTLPPDLSAFSPAPAGEYRMRGSGEIVVDPDWIATWTIQASER